MIPFLHRLIYALVMNGVYVALVGGVSLIITSHCGLSAAEAAENARQRLSGTDFVALAGFAIVLEVRNIIDR